MAISARGGYRSDFLEGIELPLPTFDLELDSKVLIRDDLRDGYIADYTHYSLVMNRETKQAIFSAANLDQNAFKKVKGRDWFVDPRIGAENQIGLSAYKANDWDRGHLTRRTAVTWGTTSRLAKRASNDSCSYANACLQHENFNPDEWRIPEEIVRYLDKDIDGKISVFTGPIFTDYDRWFFQSGMVAPVRIPSAFWKLIAYIDKETSKLACQGYIVYQDDLFLQDRKGRKTLQAEQFQVSTTEIETCTGLEFPEILFEENPVYFYPHEGINDEPERFLVPGRIAQQIEDHEELAERVVFCRDDAESEDFDRRRGNSKP